MDNGHTNDMKDDFEQSFMNSVNQAVSNQAAGGATLPASAQDTVQAQNAAPASVQNKVSGQAIFSAPTVSAPTSSTPTPTDGGTEKKFPIFVITTVIGAVATIVLAVVLVLSNAKPSIASDPSENVRLNGSGNVEAIGAYCKMDDGTVYLELSNTYFVEPKDVGNTLIELEDGTYEQLEMNVEAGHYTMDGNLIHFFPEDGSDYHGKYASHKLTVGTNEYQCVNYD